MREGFGKDYRPIGAQEEDAEASPYRYRWLAFAFGGFAVVILAFLLVLAPKAERQAQGPTQVAATIFPIYDITRNIAGDAVAVGLVLPPLASPHIYEPSPTQVADLQDVKLYFAVGHGLDDWTSDLFGLQADKVVVDEGIAILSVRDPHRKGADSGDVKEDASSGTDPHYWLSIPNAKVIARNIKNALVKRFPAYEATFERNYLRYLDRLDLAETEIRDGFSDVQDRDMITLHDSWYYFAVAYGFDIAGTFEPAPGREPTPRYLADLSATVDAIGAHVLYGDPQIAAQGIEPFAKDHGLTIVELDPLGGTDGKDSYINLMKYDAKVIRQNQD